MVAGVLSNSGSGHALTHPFAVFGYHVTGSTGTLSCLRADQATGNIKRAGAKIEDALWALTGPVRDPAEFRYAMGGRCRTRAPQGRACRTTPGPAHRGWLHLLRLV